MKATRIASGVECNEDVNASRGWFNRFRKIANIHSIRLQGEAADADAKMASELLLIKCCMQLYCMQYNGGYRVSVNTYLCFKVYMLRCFTIVTVKRDTIFYCLNVLSGRLT